MKNSRDGDVADETIRNIRKMIRSRMPELIARMLGMAQGVDDEPPSVRLEAADSLLSRIRVGQVPDVVLPGTDMGGHTLRSMLRQAVEQVMKTTTGKLQHRAAAILVRDGACHG